MTEWEKQISRRWVVHGGSLAHVSPGNALLCWGKSQEPWGGRMPTPLTLQMLWFQGRKTEVKQSLVGHVAGRAVISLLLPQTHYLQLSINTRVPKNTSSGFLQHRLTAAYSSPTSPYCLLTFFLLLPLYFQSFHFPLFFTLCFSLFHFHYSPGKASN